MEITKKFDFQLFIQFYFVSQQLILFFHMQGFQNGGHVKIQIQVKRRKPGANDGWDSEKNISPQGNSIFSFLQKSCNAFLKNKSLWGNDVEGLNWVKEQMKRQAYEIIDTCQSPEKCLARVNDIQNRQVTYLEPSPAESKLKQLMREGKTFEDTRFPPIESSLHGKQVDKQWKQRYQWRKISEVFQNPSIFSGQVEPSDIKQGELGDCYFLAGLAALAERPDRIFNLFLVQQLNKVKYYSVKLLYKGKWMTIDMDEYIPCYKSSLFSQSPCFSKAINNELWVILLQKAWAKLYKSYKYIEAGTPQQVLHDLTGAPTKCLHNKMQTQDFKNWRYLAQASQKQWAIVAGSNPGKDHFHLSARGIALSHAYTILNATVIDFQGTKQKIVQLRNPWGNHQYDEKKGQYCGAWCDNDPNWNLISQSEKDRLGFKKDAQDGLFFMSYQHFLEEFSNFTVAEINDNASYVYKTLKDKKGEGVYFKVTIKKQGHYSFQVDNTPQRTYPERTQRVMYPAIRLKIGEAKYDPFIRVSDSRNFRTYSQSKQLKPGTYIAYVQVDFDRSVQTDFDVNLAVYSEFACQIEAAPRDLVARFTNDPATTWNPAEHQTKQAWNDLSNQNYHKGDSGWGNYDPNKGNNINNSRGNTQQNNDGWGTYFEEKKPANDGWGQPSDNHNNGWGNNNNGWDTPKNNKNDNNNNGWGNDNNGWGTPSQNNSNNNDGWGNTKKSNDNNGWGSTNTNNNNNGWGTPTQNDNSSNGWGNINNNNGWGQNPNSNNNGWGTNGAQNKENTNTNDGWGNHFDKNEKKGSQTNDGWGNYFDQKSKAHQNKPFVEHNNGWGNSQNSNNGW